MKVIVYLVALGVMTSPGFATMDLPNEPLPSPSSTHSVHSPPPEAVDELGVVFDLQDGSHIVGRITPRNLPVVIRSESIGEVKIFLERIRGIQFAVSNQQVVVTLQNGDKLQGALLQEKFNLATIFGRVSIGVGQIKRFEVKSTPSATGQRLTPEDWEQVPFARNSNWGGNRGSPTEFRDDEIVLLGRGVRTRQAYSGPVTVECEIVLDERTTSDGSIGIQFVPADEPVDMDPQQLITWRIVYRNAGANNGRDALTIEGENGQLWGEKPFHVEPGQAYRIRLEVSPDRIQFQVDDKKYEAPEIKVPYDKFQIYLKGWQPGTRWQVRDFRIR